MSQQAGKASACHSMEAQEPGNPECLMPLCGDLCSPVPPCWYLCWALHWFMLHMEVWLDADLSVEVQRSVGTGEFPAPHASVMGHVLTCTSAWSMGYCRIWCRFQHGGTGCWRFPGSHAVLHLCTGTHSAPSFFTWHELIYVPARRNRSARDVGNPWERGTHHPVKQISCSTSFGSVCFYPQICYKRQLVSTVIMGEGILGSKGLIFWELGTG